MFKRIKVPGQGIASQQTTSIVKLKQDARKLRERFPGNILLVQEWKNGQWVSKEELERA